MAATGKTPILLYGSTTPTNAPVAGNLTNSSDGCEIAINVADKNLFFKDSTNAVNTVPIRQSSASSNGWLSSIDWSTFNSKVSSQWITSGSNIYYSAGSVGIGTNSPNRQTEITGSGAGGVLGISNSGSGTGILYGRIAMYANGLSGAYIDYGGEIRSYSGAGIDYSDLRFYTAAGATSTEKARIFASGGVSIGNTTDPGAGNFTISGATATKASGTTWANPSDIRLKNNIRPFTKSINELVQINPCVWEYNGKGGTVSGTKGLGVIADEIEKILPETVDTYVSKLNKNDLEETEIKRFDATEITWILVNAVKDLNEIVKLQSEQIKWLQGAIK